MISGKLVEKVNKEKLINLVEPFKDPRIKKLIDLMGEPLRTFDVFIESEKRVYKNVLVGCVAKKEKVEPEIKRYLGPKIDGWKQQIKLMGWIPRHHPYVGGSATPEYIKVFEDGVVQFAGFGQDWQSEPGYSWAIFGHITKKHENLNE